MTASRLLILLLTLLAGPAMAQTIATSPRPDHVAVTVYRDPGRPAGQGLNLGWLNGYALISETRRVTLPAGTSELRFEGVAGGILPQSAIVTGLPEGVIERNRDAYLLSPATLIDRSLGQRVHLRRTSRATGQVREQDAIVRTGANGAVVLQTEGGFEALRCTGLPETVTYDGVPTGLSARPTLSVRATSAAPVEATVTLSYLSSGFDWQADYVATLGADGRHVDLFAWLTLANGDDTGFQGADTQAVAGRLNRTYAQVQPREGGPLQITCWPQGTTSDIPLMNAETAEDVGILEDRRGYADAGAPPPPPPPAPPPPPPPLIAQQEALGDLKLYRIPEPVTVAAHSQKQVALLQQLNVPIEIVYRRTALPTATSVELPAERVLVAHNRTADGLGLPLPAGRLILLAPGGDRSLLVGQGSVDDHAVGEDVEIGIGQAPGIRSRLTLLPTGTKTRWDYVLTVSSDRPEPIRFEALIETMGSELVRARLPRRAGVPLWAVTVPANGEVMLHYSLARQLVP